jgi:hypothetical protein
VSEQTIHEQGTHRENDRSSDSGTTASAGGEVGRVSASDALDHRLVVQRAGGRPPEEASSENPEEQAAVILEESAERTEQRASRSG